MKLIRMLGVQTLQPPRDVTAVCPGCKVMSRLVPAHSMIRDVVDEHESDEIEYGYFGIRLCPDKRCNTLLFFYSTLGDIYLYPNNSDVDMDVEHVPNNIGEDALEALRNFNSCSWKSTAMMCRRALQAACIDKGAASGKQLNQQIDELQSLGLLTKQLQDWAHQIRHFGNFSAHPDENIGDTTKEDAEQMIYFLNTFLKYMYEMPALIKVAQQRSGKK